MSNAASPSAVTQYRRSPTGGTTLSRRWGRRTVTSREEASAADSKETDGKMPMTKEQEALESGVLAVVSGPR